MSYTVSYFEIRHCWTTLIILPLTTDGLRQQYFCADYKTALIYNMRPQYLSTLMAIAASVPQIPAHGFLSCVEANGREYPAVLPSWHLLGKTPSVSWYSLNYGQQNPIYSKTVDSDNMACHVDATPGSGVVNVKPGDTITLTWETPEQGPWRPSHEGPVIDYMASCGGDCRQASAKQLKFFKIAQSGMFESPHKEPGSPGSFGRWGTDILRGKLPLYSSTMALDAKLIINR